MGQLTLSDIEYGNRKRKTKRETFLEMMDKIIPWAAWVEFIRPYYPKGERGRPPIGIETMLRMYLMQNWFTLSEGRVIPNLCVLGDAAGIAAAYAVNNGKQPRYLVDADIAAIQTTLKNDCLACLDK